MNGLVEITGLWAKKDKDGNEYFTGNIGKSSVIIFKNKGKKQDNHPDYRLYITENKKQEHAKEPSFDVSEELPF